MSVHLELGKTYGAILDAARNRRFISYGDLARVNNTDWKAVRYKMPHHLWELVKVAADRKWPMPTAIVVNKKNIDTGTMNGSALIGFLNAARECGFDVSSPGALLFNNYS